MKKNKKLIILFVGIVILIAICLVYKLYKNTEIKKMKTALQPSWQSTSSQSKQGADSMVKVSGLNLGKFTSSNA